MASFGKGIGALNNSSWQQIRPKMGQSCTLLAKGVFKNKQGTQQVRKANEMKPNERQFTNARRKALRRSGIWEQYLFLLFFIMFQHRAFCQVRKQCAWHQELPHTTLSPKMDTCTYRPQNNNVNMEEIRGHPEFAAQQQPSMFRHTGLGNYCSLDRHFSGTHRFQNTLLAGCSEVVCCIPIHIVRLHLSLWLIINSRSQ